MSAARMTVLEALAKLALVAAPIALFGWANGAPYVRTGPTVLHFDWSGAFTRAECRYFGIQGTRHLSFKDADHCPALVLLPPLAARQAVSTL